MTAAKTQIGSGELSEKKTICTVCDSSSLCGMTLLVRDGVVERVRGDADHKVSKGVLCPKGAAFREYLYNDDRIKTPLKRVGPRGTNRFEQVSWAEAYSLIADKLNCCKEKFGPETVVFGSGYAKQYRPFLKRLAHSFGSPNYITEGSTCYEALILAQKLVYGAATRPDFTNSDCLLIWGRNPFSSNLRTAVRVSEAQKRGMKLIVVDPRATPTTERADLHLQLHPGADGILAFALANIIIQKGYYDQEFVQNYAHGFAEYRAQAAKFPLAAAASATGVPAEQIEAAAEMFATANRASVLFSSQAVVHHVHGIDNQRAVCMLVGLTGNFDAEGGNRVSSVSYINQPGRIVTREQEYTQPKPWSAMKPRLGQDRYPVWSELIDEAQAMHLTEQMRTGFPYPIKALVGFGLNHRMWPASDELLAGIAGLDFFVNVELFMTPTCLHADLVLPACSSAERSEVRCYSAGYIILTQPAIEPLYESKSDVDIIFDLAKELELDDPLLEAGYERSIDWIFEPSGITVAELKKHPSGMFVPNPTPCPPQAYRRQALDTPSGKFEFFSEVLAKHNLANFRVEALSPPAAKSVCSPDYPYVLNTGCRLLPHVNSRTYRVPRLLKMAGDPYFADIHPDDAAREGIGQGEAIRVTTPQGSIALFANLTPSAHPGVVHITHGNPKQNVNVLFPADYLDPISGYPGFKGVGCRLERAAKSEKP